MDKIKRQTNFELLRIFAMFMIVFYHCNIHAGFDLNSVPFSMNTLLIQSLNVFGKIGVNIFVFITGYFMVNKSFSWQKLARLYFTILFYSVTIPLLLYLMGKIDNYPFGIAFQPIYKRTYWFLTAYFALFIFAPFINIFIKNATLKELQLCIAVCVVLWSIIPTLLNFNILYFNDLIWFIVMYLIGAYTRIHPFNYPIKKLLIWIMSGFCIAWGFNWLYDAQPVYLETYFISHESNSILILGIAFCIFKVFEQLNIPYYPWINWVAASMLPVYLIHENPYVFGFLWDDVFHRQDYIQSPHLLANTFFCAFVVFVAAVLIDKIRVYLISKPVQKILQKMNKSA